MKTPLEEEFDPTNFYVQLPNFLADSLRFYSLPQSIHMFEGDTLN
jgi:hypothetical protein